MKLSKERLEEIHLAITLWKESDLSQGEFCRQENIHRATFQSWRKKYDPSYGEGYRQAPPKAKDKFLTVRVSDDDKFIENIELPLDIEICYPNKVKVKCLSNLDSKILHILINLY
jgi:hypothetical protein